MKISVLQSAALVLGAAALGGSAAPVPALGGAQLGMALSAWRALPLPAHVDSDTTRLCHKTPAGPRAGAAGFLTCEYVATIGKVVLPQDIELGGGVDATRVSYVFANDRLVAIRYTASIDDFDQVQQRLTSRYGPPVKVQRDDVKSELGPLPRVRDLWSTPAGKVQLVDPAPPYDVLEVTLGAAPPAP